MWIASDWVPEFNKWRSAVPEQLRHPADTNKKKFNKWRSAVPEQR